MITLHYYPGNASLAPHVLLHELGLPFELAPVDRANDAHKSPPYLKLNPNGLIPVLQDDGLVLYESAAICLHLVDRYGANTPLATALGSAQRAQLYKWMFWMSNTLQATLMHYFYGQRLLDEGNVEGAAQVKAHAQAKVIECLQQLQAQFESHGQPWLLGAEYSLADAYVFMLCRWTRGFDRSPARSFSQLNAHLQRMAQRPAVQRVIATEALPEPLF